MTWPLTKTIFVVEEDKDNDWGEPLKKQHGYFNTLETYSAP